MGRIEKHSVEVPSSFLCPISLDVMRSPVSLRTGVTYDRTSIRRWLDSGNNTCPATMQPLPSSPDLVPNLNLRRLIKLWAEAEADAAAVNNNNNNADVLEDIRTSADPVPSIRKFLAIMTDESIDGLEKSRLIGPCGGARLLAAKLAENDNHSSPDLCVAESVVAVIAEILRSTTCSGHDGASRKAMVSALTTTAVPSLLFVLKRGSSPNSRANAAAVLDAVINNDPNPNSESKVTIAEKKDLLSELVRVVSDRTAVEAGLSCLVGLAEVRRARIKMVQLGIVSVLTRVLNDRTGYAAAVAEKALRLLEVAAGSAGGREEICGLGEECAGAVLGSMMKVGREGTESAVAVLWSVCHRFRDRRATEAVAGCRGGLTRMLLLTQGNCAPAVRQMTGDLLKIFRVDARSCLLGYDTKATHIMPF